MTDGNRWDPAAYDDGHSFVHEYGTDLLDLLDAGPGERVLDLGCGTGHLSARLAGTGAECVGLDASRAMVEGARERHPDVEFVHGDARGFDLGTFDAVVSNAMLHWVDGGDQDRVLESVARSLPSGGRFVAELGGVGNVAAVVDAVGEALESREYDATNPWYFPSVGEYTSRLERAGFEVRLARLFDRPTELEDGEAGLRMWLEAFGDELFEAVPAAEHDAVVRAVEERLRPVLFDDGTWTVDYRRLRFVAVRE